MKRSVVSGAVAALVLATAPQAQAGIGLGGLLGLGAPAPTPAVATTPVHLVQTTADRSSLLSPVPVAALGTSGRSLADVTVDPTRRSQPVEGFGATMTESSAYVLGHDLTAAQRAATMTSLFSPTQGIGLSYLRLPIGANDFSLGTYSYDDGPADPTLSRFSIAHDQTWLIPAVKQALALNPSLSVLASPWSAPAWMKTSGSMVGGSLLPTATAAYAAYLVKYVQAYAAQGITVGAITLQNEPDYSPPGYPGMTLTEAQEAALFPVVGRAFQAAGLHTRLIGFDSNWGEASYATSLAADPAVKPWLSGVAFHCYAGDPSAQTQVPATVPVLETECTGTSAYTDFGGNLHNGTHTLVMQGLGDGARSVMLWNLALDRSYGPTNGGCLTCTGVLQVDAATGTVTRNAEFYVLGQLSSFVRPGAVRIASGTAMNLETVAFTNPDGSTVLEVLNSGSWNQSFSVTVGGRSLSTSIPAGAVQTYTW